MTWLHYVGTALEWAGLLTIGFAVGMTIERKRARLANYKNMEAYVNTYFARKTAETENLSDSDVASRVAPIDDAPKSAPGAPF